MRLILEAGTNQHRKNLPISNKVAVIILNKYNDASFRDIVLTEHATPNKPLQYCYISSAYAAYIPLHYVLLFPRGDTGWHQGLQLRDSNQARQQAYQQDHLTQQAYFQFYLYIYNNFRLVPFAYCQLFQQYIIDIWLLYN